MKKAIVISLVLVMLVTGVPILMGMSGMGTCAECGPAVLLASCAAAILVGGVLLLQSRPALRMRFNLALLPGPYYGQALERPPQLV